ncbi:MAG: HNH endonuclease [Chloroflexi bacterium]|nr:HNH endonuclease [Chloroflexota bacterium]
MAFPQNVRTKALLWCDRHCCLCKKACGVNIEVHHLVPESEGGGNEIDNAIPLCFDCHSEVMRYNIEHPRGTKYKIDELKARREQVYEEFTRHLVPPLHYEITQIIPGGYARTFPDVGFVIRHVGDSLQVRVRVIVASLFNGKSETLPSDLYSGKKLWNLNPRLMFSGHFEMPRELIPKDRPLELRVVVSIIDQYEREHPQLPTGFVYVADKNYWYAEP